MSTPDPFSPIEKAPLFASDQMQSKGYSVRIEDSGTESGWKEVGLVSDDYLLVPNTEVRDMAFEVARQSPFEWQKEKVQFDGKRFAFALSAKTGYGREAKPDDIVSLGLLFRNSYDGSLKLSASLFASLFAYRLVCSNGMLSPQLFSRVRFKHELRSQGWEEDAQKALSMIHGAEWSCPVFGDSQQLAAASLSRCSFS